MRVRRFLKGFGQLLLIWLAIMVACGIGELLLAAGDPLHLGEQAHNVRTMT